MNAKAEKLIKYSPGTHRKLERVAKKNGMSLNTFIANALDLVSDSNQITNKVIRRVNG